MTVECVRIGQKRRVCYYPAAFDDGVKLKQTNVVITMLTTEQIMFRLVLAAALGSVVGLERERLDWAAGLRTHMLVSLGACLFMVVSAYGFMDVLSHPQISLDPSRVAAQVVSGIGFLGAGTIIFRSNVIRGLTTAASLWTVAAVGLAVGGGLYASAVGTTALIIVILALVKPIERHLFRNRRARSLKLTITQGISLSEIETIMEKNRTHIKQIIIQNGDTQQTHFVEIVVSPTPQKSLLPVMEAFRAHPDVIEVNYSTT